MNDRDAFLEAIHAAPDDDAPRLIFADWLDEHGESDRAEFIRIQVEMRRERERNDRITPRLDELFLREKELFQRPWAKVGHRLGAYAIAAYSRGFPDGLYLTAKEFVAEGLSLTAWTGPQTRVRLYRCRGHLASVAAQESLRFVRSLEIFGHDHNDAYTDDDVAPLFTSPNLSGLRTLAFGGYRSLTSAVATAIASAASLIGLESLELSGIPLRSAGVVTLARARHLASLKRLGLRNTGVTRRGVNAIISSPHLKNLEKLDLLGNRVTPEDYGRLLAHFGEGVVDPPGR